MQCVKNVDIFEESRMNPIFGNTDIEPNKLLCRLGYHVICNVIRHATIKLFDLQINISVSNLCKEIFKYMEKERTN